MGFAKAGLTALLAIASVWAREYPVRHEHLRKGCTGTLTVDELGVSFRAANGKHMWNWTYGDIQQLTLSPVEIGVLSYEDESWKLGADRRYRFRALQGRPFPDAYEMLKNRLDQRFVAELPDPEVKPLWEIPVKHLGRLRGSEGELVVGADRIVYRSDTPGEPRTWRYEDVVNISSSGPFQLTVTTFERARATYGGRKDFNFQLKRPLDEARYNELWRRLNRRRGAIGAPTDFREEKP